MQGERVIDATRGSRRVMGSVIAQAAAALVIAVAFAVSRIGGDSARTIYWCGELLLVVPVVVVVVGPSVTEAEGAIVAASTGVVSFVIALSYQPFYFTFGDEYQHYETLENIIQSGHLFTSNSVLPISAQFPGLELITAAFSEVSRLPIVASGSAVMGVVHTVTILAIYELGQDVLRSSQGGAVTALVYSLGPHYQVFDSYFAYTGVGLMFAFWSVAFLVRALGGETHRRPALLVASTITGGACIVSHHVTAFLLFGFLLVIALVLLCIKPRRHLRSVIVVVVAVGSMLGLWCGLVGTDVPSYFGPFLRTAIGFSAKNPPHPLIARLPVRLPRLVSAPRTGAAAVTRAIEYAGILVLLGLCAAAFLALFSSIRRSSEWPQVRRLAPFAVGSLGIYATVMVRLFVGDGVELSGRLFSYVLLPLAVMVGALATGTLPVRPRGTHAVKRRRRRRWHRYAYASVAFGLVWASSIVGGWPPAYAQLPGLVRTAAWDRSTDPAVILAANWARQNLPPHRYFVSDQMTGAVFAGLGDETEVYGVEAEVFLAAGITSSLVSLLHYYDISYIVIDSNVARELPSDGQYFSEDPYAGRYASPIPAADITKFFNWSGASVIFSDKTVSIVAVDA